MSRIVDMFDRIKLGNVRIGSGQGSGRGLGIITARRQPIWHTTVTETHRCLTGTPSIEEDVPLRLTRLAGNFLTTIPEINHLA